MQGIYVFEYRSNSEGECRLLIKTIAKDTSMSVSTVKRAIDDLARYGLLTNEFRCRENGSHTSNLYL
ncbi:helix-turn-helix domain-containing protein [Anaerotignum propionicum]